MSAEISHFLKFLVVGTIGFVINTLGLIFGVRVGLRPSVAGPLGAEAAIISNFILNNFWTFSDRTLPASQIPGKFIAFNVLSLGSVVIQFIFLRGGETIFGLEKFKKPILDNPVVARLPLVSRLKDFPPVARLSSKITAYLIFYLAGVGVGLIVNYIIYSQIIWKQQ